MKYFLCLIALISFSAFSQDVIVKKSGEKIDAKVMEITSTNIKYKAYNQPDGPIRNIAISEVDEIIYEDGTWEKFDKPRTEPDRTEREEPSRPEPPHPNVRKNEDPILQSGFFFEGILGTAFREGYYTVDNGYWDNYGNWVTSVTEYRTNDVYASLNIRLGTKWYFGSGSKWRPGLQVNFFRFGILLGGSSSGSVLDPLESLVAGPKNFTICNVGMSNAFKFNDVIGMEVNVNGGYNLEMFPYDGIITHGVAANGEVKFRYRRFGVGLDYTRIFGISVDPAFGSAYGSTRPSSTHVLGVSIGLKF